jgi:polyhydroxybutyrate depolymerase
MRIVVGGLVVSVLAACGGDPSPAVDAGPDAPVGADASVDALVDAGGPDARPTTFGGARPATLVVPGSYDPATPTPLVLVLHGYSTNTTYAAPLLQLTAAASTAGFLMIAPAGTVDSTGNHFWNATDACCNMENSQVDDVAYLDGLITEISAAYNVDPKRIYVAGHSNGAFMAYRMACAKADRIAAIVSVAGATFATPASCAPSQPVSVLQVHGTADTTIQYAGGTIMIGAANVAYPSAVGSTDRWATYDGCAATTTTGAAIDVTGDATAETTPTAHGSCPAGIGVELWTVDQAPHILAFKAGPPLLWTWMAAHPKP